MRPPIRNWPAQWKSVLVTGWLVVSIAACGSDAGTQAGGTPSATPVSSTATSSATPTPNPVVCADAAALRASLDKLAQVTVGAGAVDEIKADLEKVRADL